MASPRGFFTPCWFRDEVYLCAGHTASVEVFSPATMVIRPLPELSLPRDYRLFNSLTVSDGVCLYVFSNTRMCRWDPAVPRLFELEHSAFRCWSSVSPLAANARVGVVSMADQRWKAVSLKTGEVLKEIQIEWDYV